MQKRVSVETNDPIQPKHSLAISGLVKKLYTLSKRSISLKGTAGDDIIDIIMIVPEGEYQFKILDAKMESGRYVGLTWNTYQTQNKTAYRIQVRNLKEEAGRYVDTIQLRTDSDIQPQIRVRVNGNIRNPV